MAKVASIAVRTQTSPVAWACRILAMGGHGRLTPSAMSALRDGDHVLMKRNGIGFEEVSPTTCWRSIWMARSWPEGADPSRSGAAHRGLPARPDVGAVVHTHPPYATAFGATDAKLEMLNHDAVLFQEGLAYFDDTAELIVSPEQGAAVAAALGDKRVVVMRGHGVMVTGETCPGRSTPRSRWSGCCRSRRSPARSATSGRCRAEMADPSTRTNIGTTFRRQVLGLSDPPGRRAGLADGIRSGG